MAVAFLMRFRPPVPEPVIQLIDELGCYALAKWGRQFDTALATTKTVIDDALFFSGYKKRPDGTVDVLADYNPVEFIERMAAWGYVVAKKGLGRFFAGYDGVVGLAFAGRIDTGRATRCLRPPV